jgi:hypothetical protein
MQHFEDWAGDWQAKVEIKLEESFCFRFTYRAPSAEAIIQPFKADLSEDQDGKSTIFCAIQLVTSALEHSQTEKEI